MNHLFESTAIGKMELKNHFVKASTWEGIATEEGHLTEELKDLYGHVAKGGTGLLLTSFVRISPEDKGIPCMLGLYDDKFIGDFQSLASEVHSYGSKLIVQLVYTGSAGRENRENQIWGPSPVLYEGTGIVPEEMSVEEIGKVIELFRAAALRAKLAGADGIELHAAHGYLLSQFLSPHYNKRKDDYGGSLVNRCRILTEAYRSVREAVGEEFLLMMKINSADTVDHGFTVKECVQVCEIMDGMGIDAIEISGGSPMRRDMIKDKEKASYYKDAAIQIANKVKASIILTGGNYYLDVIEQIAAVSNVQLFGLGRPLICEPDLVKKWENKDSTKTECIACSKCKNGRCTVF